MKRINFLIHLFSLTNHSSYFTPHLAKIHPNYSTNAFDHHIQQNQIQFLIANYFRFIVRKLSLFCVPFLFNLMNKFFFLFKSYLLYKEMIILSINMTYIIIDTQLNESFNRNLPQNKQIRFDFMVALIFDHCDCREFNDRGIPCVN